MRSKYNPIKLQKELERAIKEQIKKHEGLEWKEVEEFINTTYDWGWLAQNLIDVLTDTPKILKKVGLGETISNWNDAILIAMGYVMLNSLKPIKEGRVAPGPAFVPFVDAIATVICDRIELDIKRGF